jgi:hypothetical protein
MPSNPPFQSRQTPEYSTTPNFEEWWEPFTFGVGPGGVYARTLGEAQLSELRERCRQLLGEPPFTPAAVAWAARGQP